MVMRKILLAVLLALLPLADAGAALAATTPASEQQVAQKKQQSAAEAKKTAAAKKAAAARKAQQPGWASEGFLECLFQNKDKPRSRAQRASTRASSLASMDETTGKDIDWAPASKYAIGSIVVSTPERALYFVTGTGQARRYSVGVGREGFQWSGTSTIVNKAEWPTWRPPEEMIRREAAKGHILPPEMAGGPQNPLGARAMYIGGKLYRIHGTNSPGSIGTAASSGCIRMMNADVIELYDKVKIGAKVYVYQ